MYVFYLIISRWMYGAIRHQRQQQKKYCTLYTRTHKNFNAIDASRKKSQQNEKINFVQYFNSLLLFYSVKLNFKPFCSGMWIIFVFFNLNCSTKWREMEKNRTHIPIKKSGKSRKKYLWCVCEIVHSITLEITSIRMWKNENLYLCLFRSNSLTSFIFLSCSSWKQQTIYIITIIISSFYLYFRS